MERKLVKQGRNALTVTLPAHWLHKRGLAAGHTVQITEEESGLHVQAPSGAKRTSITINARSQERSTYWHLLCAAYVEGYDHITLMHDNPSWTQQIGQHLIGMVIEEHTNTKTVLKSIIVVPEENITALVRRAGHIFVQVAHTLERLSHKTATIEELKEQERLLDDTLLYCLRHLNKYERQARSYQYFLLCAWIEMAADLIAIIALDIGTNTELARHIRAGVENYVHGVFSDDYQKLYTTLRQWRNSIKKKGYVDGLAYGLADMLYNNIGYFVTDAKYAPIAQSGAPPPSRRL